MFKGFSDSSRNKEFHGFPNLNFQMNNEAYGFSGCTFWLDAAYGLNTQTDLEAVSFWKDRIMGVSFEESTAGNQPRLIVADPSFNNLPSIDVQSNGRRLTLVSGGVPLNKSNTYALVYKKTANTNGSATTRITPLLASNTTVTAAIHYDIYVHRFGDSTNFNAFGIGGPTAGFESAVGGDTNPHIAIVSDQVMVIDGADVSPGVDWPGQQLADLVRIGGSGTNTNGTFQLAEVIVYGNNITLPDTIRLCNNLNSKYAIY
jgi:hypothetical protein